MPLVDIEIERALKSGAWKAYRNGEPIGAADLQIGPNSVDVTLGGVILEVCNYGLGGPASNNGGDMYIDPKDEYSCGENYIELPEAGLVIYPGNLYLASACESFDCSAPLWVESIYHNGWNVLHVEMDRKTWFAPMIDGRSTLARVGLSVHNTAGFGDYGFDGQFTLEISCLLPIVLYPGMRIAQVSFHELTGTPSQRYNGAYTKQTGPQPAVLGEGRI